MPSPDIEKLAKGAVKVTPPKLPKSAKAFAKSLDGVVRGESAEGAEARAASEGPTGQGAESQATGDGEASSSTPWLWPAVGVVLALALALGLWWWWRRRKSKEPAAPLLIQVDGPDALGDWKVFRRALPRAMVRVLDDFQPVIVLGNLASEKVRVIEQLTGFEDARKFYGQSVRHIGKGLEVCLGGSSLVVAPSDALLEDASSASDAGWQRVLRAICRIRTPRIVVCLSHTAIDAGEIDALIAHAGALRAHIDLVCLIRGGNVEVSVVVPQSTRPGKARGGRDEPASHVLFELLGELVKRESERNALQIDLSDLTVGLGAEQRKKDGAAWARAKLQGYYRGWSALLAREGQDAENTLALVRLFEHLDSLSVALGAVLSELFVRPENQLQCGRGKLLYLLPSEGERLVGAVDAFDGPSPEAENRWYPSATLQHRLWVASGVTLLSVLIYWKFVSDRGDWDEAAKAALKYDLPNAIDSVEALEGSARSAVSRLSEPQELRAVQEYFNQSCTLGKFCGLPDFFDREPPRRYVVERVRRFLRKRIKEARTELPEVQLQLAALHVTSTPADCEISGGPRAQDEYDTLSRIIKDNAEDWTAVTDLGVSEISGYLDLACPDTTGDLEGAFPTTIRHDIPAVARAVDLAALLQGLEGGCRNVDKDEQKFKNVESLLSGGTMLGVHQKATLSVLDQMGKMDEGSIRAVYERFLSYRARFEALEDLGEQEEKLALVLADIAPFRIKPDEKDGQSACALRKFNRRLEAILAVPEPVGERALHLKFNSQTYVVERGRVRESLRYVAFARLVRALTQCAGAGGQGLFESAIEPQRPYVWLDRPQAGLGRLRRSVPGEYTVEAFSAGVKAPLGELERFAGELSCSDPEAGVEVMPQSSRELNDLVRKSLAGYASAYEREWRRIYESFDIRGGNAGALMSLLDELTRPTSPQLGLFQEVVKQTRLVLEDGSAFEDTLASVANRYTAVAAAIQDAPFEDYRAMLAELGSAVATAGSEAAPSQAMVPEEGEDELPRSPDTAAALALFSSKLSVFGRSVFEGQTGQSEDLAKRVVEWTQRAGIPANQRAPFIEPFGMAAESGCADIRGELKSWWNGVEKAISSGFLGNFPFALDGSSDAEVSSLVEWLHPIDGRFTVEIAPVFAAAANCRTAEVNLAGYETYERLKQIQRALFDGKGNPRRLKLTFEPLALRPEKGAELAPSATVLRVENQLHKYFNTDPQRFDIAVPWDSPYDASLTVTVLYASGDDTPLTPLSESSSSWSLLRLLKLAAQGESSSEFLWSIPDDSGTSSTKARVGYRVCQGGQRCGGLFEKVLAWPNR